MAPWFMVRGADVIHDFAVPGVWTKHLYYLNEKVCTTDNVQKSIVGYTTGSCLLLYVEAVSLGKYLAWLDSSFTDSIPLREGVEGS